jgi:hypothetical protein
VARSPQPHRTFWIATCAILAFGLWLRADVFRYEFSLDDYAQLAMLEGRYPAPRSVFDLYTFSNGSREDVQAIVQHGFYPWFAHPALRLSMLRPLACALTALDHAVFHNHALGYHLHSALWWCAALLLLAWSLRGLFGERIALFALALFTVDESHSVALGWIVNRNALMSVAFSLGALSAYRAFRETGSRRAAWLTAGLFSVALAAGEYALCIAAYALAYELIEVRSAWVPRLRALTLWAAPAFAYLLCRSLGGFGAYGSDMYLDPTRDFGFFLRHGLVRLPVLLGDVVWGLPSEWWTFGLSGWTQSLVGLGLLPASTLAPEPARALQASLGAVGGLIAAGLVFAAVRGAGSDAERRRVAWLAAGGGVSLLPLLAGFPSTRALLSPLIGYSALLAVLAAQALRRGPHGVLARTAHVAAALLCCLQLWIGTREAASTARNLAIDANLVRDVALNAEVDEARLSSQRAVLLNSAHPGVPIYFSLARGQYGRSVPQSSWTLNPSFSPFWLTRTNDRTLELDILGGSLLTGLFERVFRTHEATVRTGQRFELRGLTVTALATREGGISRLRAEFDTRLEDPSLCFLISSATGLSRYTLPAVGERVLIPGPAFPVQLLHEP